MNTIDLNALLFAGKWAFIGLIYFILAVIVIAVRREMKSHAAGERTTSLVVPGRLRVLQPGGDARLQPGATLPLSPATALGADPDNDIVLGDPYISAHHASLTWDGSGWWVADLGSTNGTQVNGLPCPPHIPQALPAGARLEMGEMAFELVPG